MSTIEYSEKIDKILKWAQKRKKFDTTFLLSVKDFIENEDFISDAQMQSIDNIIEKCKIKL